jgi:hypothetical protein
MRTISMNGEMMSEENFDKGQYQGLMNLVESIGEVRALIKEKDTR